MNCKKCGKKLEEQYELGICNECLYSGNYPTEGIVTKKCTYCNTELSISEFYRDKDKWDGYKTICKKCTRYYYKNKYWYNKNKKSDEQYIRHLQITEMMIRKERLSKERKKRSRTDWLPKEGLYYRYRIISNDCNVIYHCSCSNR